MVFQDWALFPHLDVADNVGYGLTRTDRDGPRVGETLGIYFDTIRESHFYDLNSDGQDPLYGDARQMQTLYHEGVHQLFQETESKGRSPGENANFWVIEGVACYFESLIKIPHFRGERGRYQIGGAWGARMVSAIERGLLMPTAELVAMPQSDLQRQPNLARVYAQSTALVRMLMHAHQQRDREALVEYLREVYGGRPDGEELSRLIGRPYGELDAEYERFLNLARRTASGELTPTDAFSTKPHLPAEEPSK